MGMSMSPFSPEQVVYHQNDLKLRYKKIALGKVNSYFTVIFTFVFPTMLPSVDQLMKIAFRHSDR